MVLKSLLATGSARLTTIRAACRSGRWRLARSTGGAATITDDDRAQAAVEVNDLLGAMTARLADRPEVWRLELMKSAFTNGRTTPGLARAFAAAALADPDRPHAMTGPAGEASAFAIAAAFRDAGVPVAGRSAARLFIALGAAFAILPGLAAFGWVTLRALNWPSRLPPGIRIAVAVHAEVVNRTGHILKILRDLDPETTAIVIIGRPRIGLGAVQALLRERGWTGAVVRCFDLGAALRSLPASLRLAAAGPGAILASDYLPSYRDQVAAMFRIFLGAATASWWRAQAARPEVVVFGHNGLSDTVLLDRAQQETGARTVHWMHGVSAGRIYVGVSSLCVFQCGHDARWHDRLGDYRRNMSFPAPKPTFRQGASGWVVATNFTHPGYTFYPSVGPAHELALMDLVAAAADRSGVSPDQVVWKPHPVFYLVEPETRRIVTEALAAHGFRLWPEEDRDFSRCADFETIITTPSGVALDVLKLGRLPVMAAFHPIDPDHMLSCFTLRAGTVEGLLEQIAAARDPARAPALFEATWAAIDPGRTPAFDEIVQAARMSPEA